ncbi:hypothetical protein [Nocardioides panzhihuensis]|uniref:SnoaL-like domain-containing protein n=1 Tax=Nocardioides panzhihuensis TaxID=860243 RepID=A0A7Z0DLD9_9ACTN|nr:hypothetical protein [Nocardioides panzhihuensis]NYI77567.1 hypothetical protein [Nocardioides panzhihuensis]
MRVHAYGAVSSAIKAIEREMPGLFNIVDDEPAGRQEREKVSARFFDALQCGDAAGLQGVLAPDAQFLGDGRKPPRVGISGAGGERIAALFAVLFPRLDRLGFALERRAVRGHPGAILRDLDGRIVLALALEVFGGQVQTIRSVSAAEELGTNQM